MLGRNSGLSRTRRAISRLSISCSALNVSPRPPQRPRRVSLPERLRGLVSNRGAFPPSKRPSTSLCGCRTKIASAASGSKPRALLGESNRRRRRTRRSVFPQMPCVSPLNTVWEVRQFGGENGISTPLVYERTALLRDVASGVPATARARMDVPANRSGAEHQRANHCGVARGIGLAPSPTRQKAPEASQVSIKGMSGRRETISNRGRVGSSLTCPSRFRQALRQGKATGMRQTGMT
jgi:hypothetical protein